MSNATDNHKSVLPFKGSIVVKVTNGASQLYLASTAWPLVGRSKKGNLENSSKLVDI